jgi:hypothetical protein
MTMPEQPGAEPKVHRFRYDATGLRGKRMRLMDDFPTSDAGRPQEALMGLTDVICLDDTPSVLHNLQCRATSTTAANTTTRASSAPKTTTR